MSARQGHHMYPIHVWRIRSAYNGRTHGSAPTAIRDVDEISKGSDQYGIYQYTGQIYGSDLTWIPRRGGPACPPGRDTVRITSTFGEFVVPTTGGHAGPPLRRPMMLTKFRKESNQYDIYQYVERIYGSDLTRIPPWGQPMCPLGGDAVCITSTSGEFVMSVHVF